MKYKYPKKIQIGNTKFDIIYDKEDDGAEFLFSGEEKAYIRFGMLHHKKNPEQFLGLIIHELKEIIQVEQCTRLWNRGNDGYEFHYDHRAHTDLCSRLAGLLSKFIK